MIAGLFAESLGLLLDEGFVGEVIDFHCRAYFFESLCCGFACGFRAFAQYFIYARYVFFPHLAALAYWREFFFDYVVKKFLYSAVAYSAAGVVFL